MNIRYLRNNEINYYRWDRCIKSSFNSLIYGYSWYLNTVCQNWDALIEGDYETVMPLPIVRRFGLMGIMTPHFIGCLGIFSSNHVSNEKIEAFFKAIPHYFIFIELNINKFNRVSRHHLRVTERSHFELDLVKSYYKIAKNYDASLKEKLSKAKKYKLSPLKNISPNLLLDLYKSHSQSNKNIHKDEDDIKTLRMLISTSLRYRFGELFGVYDAYNNLCSAAFFVWSENRAILISCCTTNDGIEENAFPFLIDHFIQLYSNKFVTLIFDHFESHDCVEVYQQFGAIESQFQNIVKNRLPIISVLVKRLLKSIKSTD